MGAGDPKILVVDDQEGVRQLIYEILDREGLQVITAANGLKPWNCWKQYFRCFF